MGWIQLRAQTDRGTVYQLMPSGPNGHIFKTRFPSLLRLLTARNYTAPHLPFSLSALS